MTPAGRRTSWALAGSAALLALYWILYARAPDFHARWMRGEDRAIEWLTFGGFFGAAWVLAPVAWRARPLWVRAWLAGLALFFFICAGEEISWGQRLFGFATPESVREVNEQAEFNLHNLHLKGISPLGIVSFLLKIFGIALPLLLWNRRPRWVPVVAVAPAFMAAELLSASVRRLKPWLISRFGEDVATVVRLDTAEFKEMLWGIACLLAALALREAWRTRCPDESC